MTRTTRMAGMIGKASSVLSLIALLVVSVALPPALTAPLAPAQAQAPLEIITSTSIVADVVANVTGDAATVTPLIPVGSDPHSFEPSAQDVARLADADMVILAGLNLEEGLLDVLRAPDNERTTFELWGCLPLRPIVHDFAGLDHHHGDHESEHDHDSDEHGEDHDHESDEHDGEHGDDHESDDHDADHADDHESDDHDADHADDHESDDHDADHADDHESDEHDADHADDHAGDDLDALCADQRATVAAAFGLDSVALPGMTLREDADYFDVLAEADPHVWTDPVNVALWAVMVRDMVSAEDPANADTYAANAAAYVAQLAALDAEIATLIDAIPAEQRFIVTNHLAFNYFAARYGLTLVGTVIPGGSTLAEPSVQDVLTLIETINEVGVPAIFTETTVSADLAEQIADETGAQIVRLYTGSLSEPGGPAGTYLDYMRFNATQIATALG